ncbi:MAG: hypothetical protein ACTSVO_07125 [Candidatus Heimdallarchaeaceae archaeon]
METEELIDQINFLLLELNKHNKNTEEELIKIQFPTGVILTVENYRKQTPFILDDILQRNIAYNLMLDDVYIWLLNHFGFYSVVKEMIIKNAITNLGNVLEAIIRHIAQKNSRKIKSVSEQELKNAEPGIHKSLSILSSKRVINKKQTEEILWVWKIRCKQHLVSLKQKEFERYTIEDYNRALKTWNNLQKKLYAACEKKKI